MHVSLHQAQAAEQASQLEGTRVGGVVMFALVLAWAAWYDTWLL